MSAVVVLTMSVEDFLWLKSLLTGLAADKRLEASVAKRAEDYDYQYVLESDARGIEHFVDRLAVGAE